MVSFSILIAVFSDFEDLPFGVNCAFCVTGFGIFQWIDQAQPQSLRRGVSFLGQAIRVAIREFGVMPYIIEEDPEKTSIPRSNKGGNMRTMLGGRRR
jgi:hypothetical protein